MMSICTTRLLPCLLVSTLIGCGADQGSRSGGTQLNFEATPMPLIAPMMMAGSKTFMNDLGDTIVMDKAYLVISNIGIETDCAGATPAFSMKPLLEWMVPSAHAHSEPTPTDTGAPYVIDVLMMDGVTLDVGGLEPLPSDYCGLRLDFTAADADAENLPLGQGVLNDMIGYTVFIEGTYNGGTPFQVAYGVDIGDRNLLLSPAVTIDAANPQDSVTLRIQYDTWFTGVDPSSIDPNTLFQNIVASLQRG